MKQIMLGAALLLCGTLNVSADWNTQVYTDVLRPHGRERDSANPDILACGASSRYDVSNSELPAFQRCMARHGWRLSHTTTTHTWIDPDTGGMCFHGTFLGHQTVECEHTDESSGP